MNSFKTQGIIIKRQDFSEADRILTIFTERFGKVKALAKSVRKISAKLAGSLEPYMLVDLQLHEGKTFYIVTGASIVEDFPSIHEDLEKAASAFYLGELIDKFESEDHKTPAVFELMMETLKMMDRGEQQQNKLLLRAFEIRLLHLAGYLGDLSECLHCKSEIKPGLNAWDGEDGGIICIDCQEMFHHGQPISDNMIKLLKIFEKGELSYWVSKVRVEEELVDDLEAILSPYLHQILESDLKTERFLHNVL